MSRSARQHSRDGAKISDYRPNDVEGGAAYEAQR